MCRRRCIGGRIEIIAKGSAERGLIALLDGDFLDNGRPQIAGCTGEQIGKRARFCFKTLRLALGLCERRTDLALMLAGSRMGFLCRERGLFRDLGGFLRHGEGFRRLHQLFVAAAGFLELVQLVLDLLQLGGETLAARGLFAHGLLKRIAARVDVGKRCLRLDELGFGFCKPTLCISELFLGLIFHVGRGFRLHGEVFGLGFELGEHAGRVLDQRGLARQIALQLGDAAFEFG